MAPPSPPPFSPLYSLGVSRTNSKGREVLCLMIDGASNREIAEVLYISEWTVKNHVTSILSRINQRDRLHAARFVGPFLALIRE